MNNNKVLHFTIGPVQGFVAQARRTRDLWGGSFLLSWLSGHAMKAVLDNGGRIVFPVVHDDKGTPTDPLLKPIMSNGLGQPRIGTIPNRFKAIVPDVSVAEKCKSAVLDAWQKVCGKVWKNYVETVANACTKAVWERQVNGFWEIAWVCGDDPGDRSDDTWLDLRKNWRSHRPPDEGGDHCMIMGDWQELSGFVRYKEKERQDAFWKKLRTQNGIGQLDLREGERLCAIALVKRLFPRVAQEAIGWELNINNWPSTSYMAAIPWIIKAWQRDSTKCLAYADAVKESVTGDIMGERQTHIAYLDKEAEKAPKFKQFSGMDGNLFRVAALKNEKLTLLKDGTRDELVKQLSELKKQTDVPLSPYYALLIMDGDRMGAQLREHAQEVSKGLAKFTDSVSDIVVANNGVTIYAGGDDVLAMFPLDYAIKAAYLLREAYKKAFDNVAWASISAAIVYAHHHQPLRSVLHEAHYQLDHVAKEQNNRNSLSLCVIKGGGYSSGWVGCWEPEDGYFPAQELAARAEAFAQDTDFSSRFLYVLRDRLKDLLDDDCYPVQGINIEQVLIAEYLKNRESGSSMKQAKETVGPLLKAIKRYPGGSQPSDAQEPLQVDAPILLRFLAFKGVDE